MKIYAFYIAVVALTSMARSSAVFAQDMTCEAYAMSRCDCAASLWVKCPGYAKDKELFIDNDQKVRALTFEYESSSGAKKKFTLAQPQYGIYRYWAMKYDAGVKAELQKQLDLTLGAEDSTSLETFDIDASTTLYADEDKREVAQPQ